ncbi:MULTISPECIES: hypothetical protein [unclassified Paenibacillus]|uniref:hypothetical protein n=1 Tax=unclassified Paenibacillus TaxID=185978 RepID=UPI00055E92D5|nr:MULTISPECIES: hypothetical protein [unclassified Paenibacillus]
MTDTKNKIKAKLNATEGFHFLKNENGTWISMLKFDSQTGNLSVDGSINARELKINGENVLARH